MIDSVVAAVGLGSNLGDSLGLVTAAVATLNRIPGVSVQACSRWYRTQPLGPPQPDYLNGCALLETTLSPLALLDHLQTIETQAGRQRTLRWGPRTLDLDLILYGDLVLTTPELTLPHPHFRQRAFVLVPLAEIYPQGRDPVTGETMAALAARVNSEGVSPSVG